MATTLHVWGGKWALQSVDIDSLAVLVSMPVHLWLAHVSFLCGANVLTVYGQTYMRLAKVPVATVTVVETNNAWASPTGLCSRQSPGHH
jgi:hypothetical protein